MTSVLFVRLSAMGDVVHGLGALQALHRVRPDWRLTVVTQAHNAALIAGTAGVARVVEYDRQGGWRAMQRLRRELRRNSYDVAIDLQGNWKSAFITWISGARERLGAGSRWRQEPASRLLLRRTIAVPGAGHPAIVASALVRTLADDAPFLAPELRAEPREIEAERRVLATLGIDSRAPFRVIVLTDVGDPRALPAAVVAAETAASPYPVVHLLGPAETAISTDCPATLRHGDGEPRRLIALGAILAQNDGEVIGPDQGASHVLAAAGARCRIMFGAQDPERTAPVSAVALVHPLPPDCSPCRQRRCTHERGAVCMDFRVAKGRPVQFSVPESWG